MMFFLVFPSTVEDFGAKLGQRKFSQKASTPSAETCEPNKQPLLNVERLEINTKAEEGDWTHCSETKFNPNVPELTSSLQII